MRAKDSISTWGGHREGAGRPVELPGGMRTIAFQIDPQRLRKLTDYMIYSSHSSRSETLRSLIDGIECYEARALKEVNELEDRLEDEEPDDGGSILGQ